MEWVPCIRAPLGSIALRASKIPDRVGVNKCNDKCDLMLSSEVATRNLFWNVTHENETMGSEDEK